MNNIWELESIQADLEGCMTSYDNIHQLEDINERLKCLIEENK